VSNCAQCQMQTRQEYLETLDVGCGDQPRGDVNVDCYRYSKQVRPDKKIVKTCADVIADGQYLPFHDESFNKVVSFHVIEHVKNPYRFLKELVRVSKNEILIVCPHRFGKGAKMPYHKNYFTLPWFRKALANFKCGIEVTVTNFPKRSPFQILRPEEIQVRTFKKEWVRVGYSVQK